MGRGLAGALLGEGRAHALAVASFAPLPGLLALQRDHDLLEVNLRVWEPVVDGHAVRADADVPEALAAADQVGRVHLARGAQHPCSTIYKI